MTTSQSKAIPRDFVKPFLDLVVKLILFFLMAWVIQTLFFAVLHDRWSVEDSTDFQAVYYPAAQNLLAWKGYTLDSKLVTIYPPLDSILIACVLFISKVTGLAESPLLWFYSLICSAVTGLILYETALFLVPNRKLAYLAPLVMFTYPFYLWLTKQPNTEQIFMVFLFAGLYLLARLLIKGHKSKIEYVLPGFLMGLSSLIRPIGLFVAIFFALFCGFYWLLIKKKVEILIPVAIIFGNFLAILPWELYVYEATGEIIPISSQGNAALRLSFNFAGQVRDPRNEIALPEDVETMMDRLYVNAGPHQTTLEIFSILMAELRQDPTAFVQLISIKLYRALYATVSGNFDNLARWAQIPYLVLIAACFWIGLSRAQYRLLTSISIAVFIYFWGMTLVALPILRYMMPALCYCFCLTPLVVVSVQELRGRRITSEKR
jgi:hypothetical protein